MELKDRNSVREINALVAPYVSDRTAEICEKNGIGYFDCAGNILYRKEGWNEMEQNETSTIVAVLSPVLVFAGVVIQIFYNNWTRRKERNYEKRDKAYVAFLTICNELVVEGRKLFEQGYYPAFINSYFMVRLYAPKKLRKVIKDFKERLDGEYGQYCSAVNSGIWDFNIQKEILLEYDYPSGEHVAKVDNDIWNKISESREEFFENHVIDKKEIETYINPITNEMSRNN